MATAIPPTMKAVVIEREGGPDELHYRTDYPTPSPGEGELLVKNLVIGINMIDTYFRSGLYPLAQKPAITGQEASGTVAALGPGTSNPLGFSVGDRVVWMNTAAYAEYTVVPADKTVKIPDDLSHEDAVGGFLMGMTALSLVREAYPVQRGDWVLLHAAAGGVGLLMCQLLRTIGARTIATASGAEKCELAKRNGADHTIDYKRPTTTTPSSPSWLDQVNTLTSNTGVSVVYDSVGADTWEASLAAAARKGKVVFYGNASGPVPPLPLTKLTVKNLSVARPSVINYTTTRAELEGYADAVLGMVGKGELKVRIHERYPLRDAARAHKDLEARKTMGKLLLVP